LPAHYRGREAEITHDENTYIPQSSEHGALEQGLLVVLRVDRRVQGRVVIGAQPVSVQHVPPFLLAIALHLLASVAADGRQALEAPAAPDFDSLELRREYPPTPADALQKF